MTLSEILTEGLQVLESLDRMTESIKPMVKEDFVRDDPALEAFNSIGASRRPIRQGLRQIQNLMGGGG
jgi:hypothetical protein